MKSEVDDPDHALVEAMARGERAALAALMSRHLDRLYGLCRRTLGVAAEAEEVVQDTFLRAWRQAGRWRPGEARYATWLHQVALNRCRDRLRRRTSEGVREGIETEALSDPSPGPESLVRREQLRRRLSEAVAELPERQREALLLCVYQELSQAEAAKVLAISEHALESLLARARRGLRERLNEALVLEERS